MSIMKPWLDYDHDGCSDSDDDDDDLGIHKFKRLSHQFTSIRLLAPVGSVVAVKVSITEVLIKFEVHK